MKKLVFFAILSVATMGVSMSSCLTDNDKKGGDSIPDSIETSIETSVDDSAEVVAVTPEDSAASETAN